MSGHNFEVSNFNVTSSEVEVLGQTGVGDPSRIAVCMAAHNGMRWLEAQVESILCQVEVSLVLFISVDESEDGTEGWVDELAKAEARVQVLPHGVRFGGAAPNFFRLLGEVNFSEFDFVCLADQDDIWYPDKLSRARDVLEMQMADAYSSDVIAVWSNGAQQQIVKSQPQKKWDFLFEAAGPGCTYVLRTDLVLAIQHRLRENVEVVRSIGLHDWFLYAYARANGYKWVIDSRPGMLYRQHGKNQVGVNAGGRAFVYRGRKILSGWGLSQSRRIASLIGLDRDAFVQRALGGSRLGLLWLSVHAAQCRRRLRDQLFFLGSCAILAVVGWRPR
jgi:rhamnosyltransferase